MSTMRLIGLYTSMKVLGAPTTADGLSKAFGGDRKTYLKDLNALKKAGLLHRRIEKINGKPVTVTKLSDDSPLKGLLILLSQQNSSLILNANSIYKQIKNHGGAVMGDSMNEYELNRYEVDEDWEREQKRKYEKQKHEDYAREKEAHAAKRIESKKTKTPADWSTDDSVYEFVERMSLLWHVTPWKAARTRFKGAMAKSRKTHGTTGDIELKMMDRFFSGIEHNKSINDPELIWRSFIKQFESLLIDVQQSTVTIEDIARAVEISDKQWEKY